jgi:hypothetical protein
MRASRARPSVASVALPSALANTFGCAFFIRTALMAALGSATVLGCESAASDSEENSDGAVSLVDHNLWTAMAAGEDPFPDRPAEVTCPPRGYGLDAGAFGVYTGECNYITATQPILVDLQVGDIVTFEIGYGVLASTVPAVGHMVLALPSLTMKDVVVPIPGTGKFYAEDVEIKVPLSKGTPILFHVHNHGPNSWRVLRVERTRPKAPRS